MIEYKLLEQSNDQIIKLLTETVWGLKGPLFSHNEVAHRIASNPKNYYFCAYDNKSLAGIVVCCEREGLVGGQKTKCIYTRYFSVHPNYRGQKIGEQLLNFAEGYFEPQFYEEPVVFYAYQDKKNASSMKVADNKNFQIYSDFETFTFSRISPSRKLILEEITDDELINLRSNHLNTTDHYNKVYNTNCYCVKDENNAILCAGRFLNSSWTIVKVPGWQGFLMQWVVSRIPILNRLFNRKSFDFIAIDHVYASPNCNSDIIQDFLESVLKEKNKHIALLWSDLKDSIYSTYKGFPKPGLLERLNSNVPACIRVEHRNLNENQIKTLNENPFFISSLDLT